jgi:hypothetical protein
MTRLVAAGILTANVEQIINRWKLEGGLPPVPGQKVDDPMVTGQAQVQNIPLRWQKQGYRILPNSDLGPTVTGDLSFRGSFVVYDWDTKKIVWQESWGDLVTMVAGFCFADDVLYLADLEGASIFLAKTGQDTGKLIRRISHPYLNDIHSLERTRNGLLVTSSGNDLIIELDLDGNSLYEWWATDHGYDRTPSGDVRTHGRGQEHRDQYYHTRYHTTHLNCATFRDPEERYLLALLFHQGLLIQIDRLLPYEEQRGEVILEGLARPHSLEKTPDGWLFCNSLAKELLLLNDDLQIVERIPYDGGWIQDCTMLKNGHILLNDVDNHRLVEMAEPGWETVHVEQYAENWRMGELLEIPPQYVQGFLEAAGTAAQR